MAEWAVSQEWPVQPFGYYQQYPYQPFVAMPCQPHSYESQAQQTQNYQAPCPPAMQPVQYNGAANPQRDNPREIRNKAEKLRRDKLNETITDLSQIVPPVVTASRKIDKIGILRLTAHFLRSHQYARGGGRRDHVQQQVVAGAARGAGIAT
ncbi:hypothetical protein MSG28_001080 [Choristoneura fumiferana]|uniref:Uncharacterized protein n=1 Tax=Choristoneura fumiferana TaxID=7141 RepID=A0ACC0K3F6_CHOFU|nr:hypothetical protein MSG28_001080 [Choristoneura fumiferana]